MTRLYIKKPVTVEAWQWTGQRRDKWPNFMSGSIISEIKEGRKVAFLSIVTLEGRMEASRGDWIVCGVEGELYPVKPSIFLKTYEPK
jgi:hypothetical protein